MTDLDAAELKKMRIELDTVNDGAAGNGNFEARMPFGVFAM